MPELTDVEEDAEEFDVMIDKETLLRACFNDDDILDLPCNQSVSQMVEQTTDEPMETHVDEEEAAVNVEEDVSAATEHKKGVSPVRAELYDSGTTSHLSPYRENFQDYEDLPLRAFKTANEQSFNAVGRGTLVIHVPNGTGVTKLVLKDVLYAPEISYYSTLVSIGRLDALGY